ncbi:MAG: hypothetical protein RMJ88_16735 [Thermogemmata sp.]|nr:hypothetical protein [Thermogemmata sp.]
MKTNEVSGTFPFRDTVRAAVLQAAATPQTLAALKKVAKAAVNKTWAKAAEAVVSDMVAAGELYAHTQGKSPRYGRDRPPLRNDPVKVRAALLQAAETPQTAAQLVKTAVGETKADKSFVETELQKLIQEGQLHPQGTGKSPRYGLHKLPPPHPLDVPPGKTAFARLVTAARKLLETHPTLTAEELLKRLQLEINRPVNLQDIIKKAYDDLCLDPDFHDRLVEIWRLYHWLRRKIPSLTIQEFHNELLRMEKDRVVELQALNEVQRAKEPELAIRRNERLLYYLYWRLK